MASSDQLTRRAQRWMPVALLATVIFAASWKLTVGDRIIARGDLLLYFYPLRDYASQAIRELRLPLWNPYTFMGAPFLANSQVGFFYPFNVVSAWLPVERAVSWNITLHLVMAAVGAYLLGKHGLGLGRLAAFACGLTFGLGGYLGAQVEHFNQLQALAWLPLAVLSIVEGPASTGRIVAPARWILRRSVVLSAVLTLQITAGHTQSLYICLIALGLVAVTLLAADLLQARPSLGRLAVLRACAPLIVLSLSAVLAAMIAGAQLLPALELSGESARGGGLPFTEAGSFSWRPWVIARALLPTYGDPLFAEYVAYLGAIGTALAILGARTCSGRTCVPALVLVIGGCILALGVATPLFSVLYRSLPGFNLFRAQARWLVMFALGASLLVGLGVQALRDGLTTRQWRNWLIAWLAVLIALIVGLSLGARISPEPEYQSLPGRNVMIGWAIAIVVTTVLIAFGWLAARRGPSRAVGLPPTTFPLLFTAALSIDLLVASQFQPYSRATDRQALTSLRPSIVHLRAEETRTASPSPAAASVNGGRILALSSLYFDPGDKVEQELIYGPQLGADEVYDRIIASKHKEILSPNLSLYYRLPSVDGYDGGLLPTRRYADFVTQFMTTPNGTVDGRLREFLTEVPDDHWLTRMAVRHVIADKTQDAFVDGVYYDMLFSTPVTTSMRTVRLRPYASTALGLVLSAEDASTGEPVARATVTFDDGSAQAFEIVASGSVTPFFGVQLEWDRRRVPVSIGLAGTRDGASPYGTSLRGLTSIDDTDGTFLSQRVRGEHDMRLVHSGDVKIYENLRAAPRVTIGPTGRHGDGFEALDSRIVDDLPEFVRIQLPDDVARPGSRLILRDACYPGWVAWVDGKASPIECVDVLFRAVDVPSGAREVVFSYEPQSVRIGMLLSAVGLGLWGLLVYVAYRFMRGSSASRRPSPTKVKEMTNNETTSDKINR
jgi:hypothetical protein